MVVKTCVMILKRLLKKKAILPCEALKALVFSSFYDSTLVLDKLFKLSLALNISLT